MISYTQAKEAALRYDSEVNSSRDIGTGWIFENSSLGDDAPFLMIKKDGEMLLDILDFLEEYMLLENKTDIPIDFETGNPL